MRLSEADICRIEPQAVLKGGLSGSFFIALITFFNREASLFLVLPPKYDLNVFPIERYQLESAIAKHKYEPVEGIVINDEQELKSFIQKINDTKIDS